MSQRYKNHLSDRSTWDQASHGEDGILYPDNLGGHICIDEVALSKGELFIGNMCPIPDQEIKVHMGRVLNSMNAE